MSRFAIATSLTLALVTLGISGTPAFARVVSVPDVRFAQPPQADLDEPPQAAPHNLQLEQSVLDRATVRAALLKNRAANLARFRAYQKAGVFPSNTYGGRKLNVWLDEAGHFCAAATIIRASGNVELTDRVAAQTNFIRLATVKQGPLMDWILTSGLTQDEIAAIQEPFMPVRSATQPDEPEPQTLVDARLRKAEDARLLKKYRQVDAMIVRNQKASLDLAVDRLMKHQDLAWNLVTGAAG